MDTWIHFIALISGITYAQQLYEVQIEEAAPVRLGSTARFRCSYVGDNITIQYVSWVKLSADGERTFVYEYSEFPPINQAYNDFVGRAIIRTDNINKSPETLAMAVRNRIRSSAQEEQPARYEADAATVGSSDILYDGHFTGNFDSAYDLTPMPDQDKGFSDTRNFSNTNNGSPDISDYISDLNRIRHISDGRFKKARYKPVSEEELDDIRDYVYGQARGTTHIIDTNPTLIPVFQSEQKTQSTGSRSVENHMQVGDEGDIYTDEPSHFINHRHFQSDSGEIDHVMSDSSLPLTYRRQRRAAEAREEPLGHVDLFLSRVQIADEATYECVVKPLGGPSMGDTISMVVQVPPGNPVITSSDKLPFVEGQNVTLQCRANVGKPAGMVTWSIMRPGDESLQEVPLRQVENKVVSHLNGTTTATSVLRMMIDEDDDGAVYRCITTSDILGNYEARPLTQLPLTVQYPPRGGRILFDTAVGRYYCHARGKPAPTYAWIWIQPDGRQTIMSTNRYLDLRGMRESGYYRFHCLASNIIHGIRHTKVMATKLRVIAPNPAKSDEPATESTTTTTTPAPPAYERQSIPYDTREKSKIYNMFVKGSPARRVLQEQRDATRGSSAPGTMIGRRKGSRASSTPRSSPRARPPQAYRDNPRVPSSQLPAIPAQNSDDAHISRPVSSRGPRVSLTNRNLSPTVPKGSKLVPQPSRQRHVPATVARSDRQSESRPVDVAYSKGQVEFPEYRGRHKHSKPHKLSSRPAHHNQISPHLAGLRDIEKISNKAQDVIDYTMGGQTQSVVPESGASQSTEIIPPLGQPEVEEEDVFPDSYEDVPYTQPEAREAPKTPEVHEPTDGTGKDDEYYYYYYYDETKKEPREKTMEQVEVETIDIPEIQNTPEVPTAAPPIVVDDQDAFANPYETVSRTPAGEYDCREKEDGVYGAGCRAFYRCRRGRAYFVECVTPYVYNKRNGKCGKPDQAPAPCGIWRDCSDKPNRKYADTERGCRHYFTCWHDFFMGHNECNPGLIFNEAQQYCDWPENVAPPCGKASKRRKHASQGLANRRYTG